MSSYRRPHNLLAISLVTPMALAGRPLHVATRAHSHVSVGRPLHVITRARSHLDPCQIIQLQISRAAMADSVDKQPSGSMSQYRKACQRSFWMMSWSQSVLKQDSVGEHLLLQAMHSMRMQMMR